MALIERDEALASLEELLAGAATGRGRVALVSGTVATGKSELLHRFAEQAIELGVLAITATGSRLERDLPLGVLGQLIQDAPLTVQERERAVALLTEGAGGMNGMPSGDPQAETLGQADAQIIHALCMVLLELSERCPLLIVVDDVHHADRASLLCLAYLSRRVRFARIVVVFSHSDHGRSAETFFQTELLRQPHCRRVALTLLSRAGVTAFVTRELGQETAERFSEDWYAFSGGNPLLITALVEDHRDSVRSSGGAPVGPAVGDRYGKAVLSCLHRGGPRMVRVARGLAVLGELDVLDRLLGGGRGDVAQGLRSLTTAGLISLGRFRHEAARTAVLAEVDTRERMDLHRRAAELAYEGGAPASAVADHLLQADRVDRPWVVPVLEDAARSALREGRVESAVAYLRLASHECTDEQDRVRITTMLVRAEWRINPGAPAAHLAELTDAMQRGSLRGGDAVVLARALLWHGRFDDARDVFEHLNESGAAADPETVTELLIARPWLRSTHPVFLSHMRPVTAEQGHAAIVSVAAIRRLDTALALSEVLAKGPQDKVVDTVERILRGCRLDEMSMDTVESALLALTYGERPDKAAPWCDLFSVEASSRHAPSRQARLAAIRAEMAIRQGDMPSAEQHARTALEIIPPSSWGVAAGGPLGSLVVAAAAMGRYEVAHAQLDRPVLDAMFQTRYGLTYLHARGRYSLATDHPALALRDFRLCGELMEEWGIDVPGLIPWRVEAAEACLRMGREEEARRLVEEQLRRCGPATPRAQGMAMRLLAATGELRHRPMLLHQAGDLLQSAGDRYELSRVLVDLAEAYHALGEFRRAEMIVSRARTVAQECRAEPLVKGLSRSDGGGGGEDSPAQEQGEPAVVLSDAERRVAVLAASGYTNREIAGKLYLTVSTVEQHLTRTYRKLNITRRADLPSSFELGGSRV
ncbi:LuxR family transcriptional regulator [Planomonospora parontospora subsp. parontospora]|uniref:LuxR family transcriptional regulator n=2 Tax=Planomonospora parontospora TaxID=58119 RepID=A0AA37BN36_9ACTN|nr:LuxR family transcriptional regulator [Planomonospora parontospora]GGK96015.1 LuxR family transcriptional regulator [Planomonospora parontospora]GII12614.1 LuxR family transcriptional regulator [Planomonospora parontospora subsp. parontospora]